MFPKIVVPQNGWFILENPIKVDDLGVPLFSETPICLELFSIRIKQANPSCSPQKKEGLHKTKGTTGGQHTAMINHNPL